METTEEPPRPDDSGWDAWADEQLDDVEYDTELGREMAADALRIANGGLSKAEFHDRYSDTVEREFGIDERPTKEAYETEQQRLAKIPNEEKQTRRDLLKAFGGAAAVGAASLAGCIGTGAQSTEDEDESGDRDGIIDEIDHQKRLGMVIDTTECIACLQCSKACKEENDTSIGTHWPYVFRYEDEVEGDAEEEQYLTRHCQHCSEPSCTFVCPTQARHQRTEDGLVLTDYDTCVGCKYCQVACPYGVNYLGKDEPNEAVSDGFDGDPVDKNGRTVGGSPPKGVMGKCTFCVHRQDSDDPELEGTTACEQRCPEDVIQFGDMNHPESDPRQLLREKREDNRYKLLQEVGNEPNIVYIGREPTHNAEPVQGPVAYEDHNMKDGNYDYVLGDGQRGGEQ